MAFTSHLPDEFFTKLKAIAARRNFYPEHALNFMMHESGVKPNIAAGNYAGLFMKRFDSATEASAFAKESAVRQLDAFDAFMAPYTNLEKTRPEHLYQLNFLPASAIPGQTHYRGNFPGSVLAAEGGGGYGGMEAAFYRDNPSLDVDKDGKITVSDLGELLAKKRETPFYQELVTRLRTSPGRWNPAPSLLVSWVGPIVMAFALGGVLYVAHRNGLIQLPRAVTRWLPA